MSHGDPRRSPRRRRHEPAPLIMPKRPYDPFGDDDDNDASRDWVGGDTPREPDYDAGYGFHRSASSAVISVWAEPGVADRLPGYLEGTGVEGVETSWEFEEADGRGWELVAWEGFDSDRAKLELALDDLMPMVYEQIEKSKSQEQVVDMLGLSRRVTAAGWRKSLKDDLGNLTFTTEKLRDGSWTGAKKLDDYVDFGYVFSMPWFKRLEANPDYKRMKTRKGIDLRDLFKSTELVLDDVSGGVASYEGYSDVIVIDPSVVDPSGPKAYTDGELLETILHELVHRADWYASGTGFSAQVPHSLSPAVTTTDESEEIDDRLEHFMDYLYTKTEMDAYGGQVYKWLYEGLTEQQITDKFVEAFIPNLSSDKYIENIIMGRDSRYREVIGEWVGELMKLIDKKLPKRMREQRWSARRAIEVLGGPVHELRLPIKEKPEDLSEWFEEEPVEDVGEFAADLMEEADQGEDAGRLRILLGKDVDTGEPDYWDPFKTEPQKLTNQHILIVGKSGSGKTQGVASFIDDLSAKGVPSLIFDFEGEYPDEKLANADGQTFLDSTKAVVLDASQGVNFNPLEVPVDPVSGEKRSFMRVVYQVPDDLSKIFELGDIQIATLQSAVGQAFANKGFVPKDKSTWANDPPSMSDLWDILKSWEGTKEKGGSSLTNLNFRIQPLFENDIFVTSEDPASAEKIFHQTSILKLSNLSTSKLMVATASFMLRKIYMNMLAKGPSSDFRLFVVIDEAHKLAYNETIDELIREGRKYGIGLMLSSQSVGDFNTIILSMAGTKVALQLGVGDAEAMVGSMALTDKQEASKAKELIVYQPPFRALVANNHFQPFAQVDIVPFFRKPTRVPKLDDEEKTTAMAIVGSKHWWRLPRTGREAMSSARWKPLYKRGAGRFDQGVSPEELDRHFDLERQLDWLQKDVSQEKGELNRMRDAGELGDVEWQEHMTPLTEREKEYMSAAQEEGTRWMKNPKVRWVSDESLAGYREAGPMRL